MVAPQKMLLRMKCLSWIRHQFLTVKSKMQNCTGLTQERFFSQRPCLSWRLVTNWNSEKVTTRSQLFMFGELHMKWVSLTEEFFMTVSMPSSPLSGITSSTKSLTNWTNSSQIFQIGKSHAESGAASPVPTLELSLQCYPSLAGQNAVQF